MGIATFLAIYFIIWWVVLFAVLPWGVRSQEESGEVILGTDPGAPATHLLWRKLLWTTVIASAVFGVLYGMYRFELIPFEFLTQISTPPHR